MKVFKRLVGLWVVGSLLLGLGCMKCHWGYFLVRPAVHSDVRNMSALEGIGYFELAPAEGSDFDKRQNLLEQLAEIPTTAERGDDYYHQEVQPLVAARRAGFDPGKAPAVPHSRVTAIVDRFIGSGLSAPDGQYDSDRGLSGYVMRFRTGDGEVLSLLSARGDQVSNDHYPYYEVLYDENLDVFHSQMYYLDWAGIEGFEGVPTFIAASIGWVFLMGVGGFCYGIPHLCREIYRALGG